MGIDTPSDTGAELQVGPTSEGMVRIYVRGDAVDLPLDFAPEDALEIAEELMAAARAARAKKPARPARGRARRPPPHKR